MSSKKLKKNWIKKIHNITCDAEYIILLYTKYN